VHIYAFGSISRGDVCRGSDIDLLALVDSYDARFDPDIFSIYSYGRIADLWGEGNPFAWHLFLESVLVFASDGSDFLRSLKSPGDYIGCLADCEKFYGVFCEAYDSIAARPASKVFELSTLFLSIRNIATCFSLGVTDNPNFSRNSARHLGSNSVPLTDSQYAILERARILSTRGKGLPITDKEVDEVLIALDNVKHWMEALIRQVRNHERIQKSNGRATADSRAN
jgi:Nucleotidyltransferase domain